MNQPPTIPSQQPPPLQQSSHAKGRQDDHFLALSRQVSDLLSRLRLLEERYANLRREHQMTSQNMIENHQAVSKQQRRVSDATVELKRALHDLDEQLATMKGELSEAARSHDLKVLERYMDYWEPLRFVTRREAERIIEEALARPNLYKSLLAQQEEHGRQTPSASARQDDAGARDGAAPDNSGPAT